MGHLSQQVATRTTHVQDTLIAAPVNALQSPAAKVDRVDGVELMRAIAHIELLVIDVRLPL
jgi:hypothetical protein